MCFAIPGLVVSVNDNTAVVSYKGEEKQCRLLINADEGDYVIVQSNQVVKKVDKKEALKIFEAFK